MISDLEFEEKAKRAFYDRMRRQGYLASEIPCPNSGLTYVKGNLCYLRNVTGVLAKVQRTEETVRYVGDRDDCYEYEASNKVMEQAGCERVPCP